MIIYNITFHIADGVRDECVRFLKTDYIPFVLRDGVLTKPQLCRVLAQSEEGSSYALQFQVDNMELLNDWWKKNGEKLSSLIVERFSDEVVGFTTLLEHIGHDVV